MYKIKYPEVEVVAITKSYIIFVGVDPENGFTEKVHHCGKNVFFQYYKELPEDKAETKPETQSHISETSLIPSNSRELSPEVKEAMEELKKEKKYFELFKKINGEYDFQEQLKGYTSVIFRKSLNLLNALDKQFKVNETSESVNVKEEEAKEKEESIWKPVSELPEDNYTVIIKAKGGYEEIFFGAYREDNQHFMDEAMKFVYPKNSIDKYCTLTDFINDYEKLKERVKKLENK